MAKESVKMDAAGEDDIKEAMVSSRIHNTTGGYREVATVVEICVYVYTCVSVVYSYVIFLNLKTTPNLWNRKLVISITNTNFGMR